MAASSDRKINDAMYSFSSPFFWRYTLTARSSTLINAHSSPLLRLPAELRNNIYAYVFARPDGYAFHENTTYRSQNRQHIMDDVILLLTCRQIYHEAQGLPLQLNELRFPTLRVFERILMPLRASQRQHIRRISLGDAGTSMMGLREGVDNLIQNMRLVGYADFSHFLPKATHVAVHFGKCPPLTNPRPPGPAFLVSIDWRRCWEEQKKDLVDWMEGGDGGVEVVVTDAEETSR
jgi:hypothetical protein